MTQLLEHTTEDEEDEESEDRTSNLVDALFVSKDPFFFPHFGTHQSVFGGRSPVSPSI